MQDWSTSYISTAARYTSNTSNWIIPIQQDWSTPTSTVAKFSSNITIYPTNFNQNWSTPVSSVTQFTSNTSNWISNLQQNWSTTVSTAAQFTSNTSNYFANFYTPQVTAGTAFSPLLVSGAVLWYDAADPAGTGVQPAYGTSITSWVNKAGTTDTMTGATMTYSNDLGGPAIYMPGGQVFTNATATLNTYVFLVCRWDSTYTNSIGLYYMISMNDLTISGQNDFSIRASSSGLVNLPLGDGSYQWDMQGDHPFINGTQIFGSTTPSYADIFTHHNIIDATVNNASPTSRLQVGTSYASGGSRTAQGWIKEILFYNNVLSTSDQQKIEGYLAWKWGLQSYLSAGHPYKSAAPTAGTGAPGIPISTAISTGAQFTSNTSNFYNPFVNYNASTAYVSTAIGAGNIYMSTFSGSSFSLSTGALVTSSIYAFTFSSLLTYTSTLLLTAAPNNYWMVDVNGFSRSAVYYSSFATPGTATLTPSTYFGVYYNMTGTGTYTIALAATQPFSNIGKYYSFRNNSANDMIVTITGGTGITSPTTIYSSNSINIMVATTNSYVLF